LPHPGRGPRVGLVVGRVRRLHEPARQDHHHIDAGHVLRGGNRMHRAEAADEIRLGGVGTQEPESGRPNRGHNQSNAPRAPELPPHTEREDLSENRQAQAPKQWVSDGLAHFPTGPNEIVTSRNPPDSSGRLTCVPSVHEVWSKSFAGGHAMAYATPDSAYSSARMRSCSRRAARRLSGASCSRAAAKTPTNVKTAKIPTAETPRSDGQLLNCRTSTTAGLPFRLLGALTHCFG